MVAAPSASGWTRAGIQVETVRRSVESITRLILTNSERNAHVARGMPGEWLPSAATAYQAIGRPFNARRVAIRPFQTGLHYVCFVPPTAEVAGR
jgi:hypothetical protein